MKDISCRGMLTDEIKEKAERYLGRKFTQKELRLYPYLQYCMLNSQKVERVRIDPDEQDILDKLVEENQVVREYPSFYKPTKRFCNFLCEILADGYVEIVEEDNGGIRW